ncbi:unnamed protein product [Cuscuta campestris]|uniref:DUF3615 domain-containing protein n=1 Tax=Cuscuta campestris TaxID=132261 RepID=A0A484KYG4_9ASTE|nr:unnamed protein product [Cuscuta campestris]
MYMSLLRPEPFHEKPEKKKKKKKSGFRIVSQPTGFGHWPGGHNDPEPVEEKTGTNKFTQEELRRNLNLRWALAPLANYNRRHATNYKLVEAINCNGFLLPAYNIWAHCAFKAATETSSVPELFFAEFYQYELHKYHFQSVTNRENF